MVVGQTVTAETLASGGHILGSEPVCKCAHERVIAGASGPGIDAWEDPREFGAAGDDGVGRKRRGPRC